jgi:hypothetical protein
MKSAETAQRRRRRYRAEETLAHLARTRTALRKLLLVRQTKVTHGFVDD